MITGATGFKVKLQFEGGHRKLEPWVESNPQCVSAVDISENNKKILWLHMYILNENKFFMIGLICFFSFPEKVKDMIKLN